MRSKSWNRLLAAFILVFALALGACRSSAPEEPPAEPTPETEPAPEDPEKKPEDPEEEPVPPRRREGASALRPEPSPNANPVPTCWSEARDKYGYVEARRKFPALYEDFIAPYRKNHK